MKFLLGLLVASLALNAVVFALPAHSPNDDAEVINVPRRRLYVQNEDTDADSDGGFKNFKGVINTDAGYPFLQAEPRPFAFNLGFFDSFEDIFRRLRTNIFGSGFPGLDGPEDGFGAGDSSSNDGPFGIDLGKGNTTSTVKVVDGHKVEVNETVYGGGDNIVRVRVVNIIPVESGEDNGEGSPVTSAPATTKAHRGEFDDEVTDDDVSDERREPLAKKPKDNEVSNREVEH